MEQSQCAKDIQYKINTLLCIERVAYHNVMLGIQYIISLFLFNSQSLLGIINDLQMFKA